MGRRTGNPAVDVVIREGERLESYVNVAARQLTKASRTYELSANDPDHAHTAYAAYQAAKRSLQRREAELAAYRQAAARLGVGI